MIVQIDYDGTITTEDVSLELQRRFAIDAQRFEYLRDQFESGLIDVVSVVQAGWANVKPDPAKLMETTLRITVLRKGIWKFLLTGHYLIIVSNGMTFYMQPFIGSLAPIIAGKFFIEENQSYGCLPCDLKLTIARALHPDIYIGNGLTDIEPSRLARKTYAVRNGGLHKRTDAIPFDSFDEIDLTS